MSTAPETAVLDVDAAAAAAAAADAAAAAGAVSPAADAPVEDAAEGSAVELEDEKFDWPVGSSEYELLQPIGEGSTATVIKARCKKNNKLVAIKMIDLDMATADLDEIVNEMMIMRRCRHPNLVSYYTCFEVHDDVTNKLWIVMRLLEKGSLLSVLRYREPRSKGCVLDENMIATILKFVVEGLVYLHQQGQIHRDVKAGNVLLGNDGSVQLADFGVSSWVAEDQFSSFEQAQGPKGKKTKKSLRQRSTFVGTPCWMAPEVMLQEPYNEKADVWSVGITALELATGAAPYARYDPMKVLMLTIDNEAPTLETCAAERGKDFAAFKKPFRKFVQLCLQKDPHNRPSAAELLKTDFIKKFAKDEEYLKKNLVDLLPSNFAQPPAEAKKPAAAVVQDGVSRFSTVTWDFGSLRDDERAALQAKGDEGKEEGGKETATEQPPAEQTPAAADPPATDGKEEPSPGLYNVLLRINKGEEIEDIKFDINYPHETPEKISEELVTEGLIRVLDASHVAGAMTTLLIHPELGQITVGLYGTKTGPDDPKLSEPVLAEGYARAFVGELANNPPPAQPPAQPADAAASATEGGEDAAAAPAPAAAAAAAPAAAPEQPAAPAAGGDTAEGDAQASGSTIATQI